MGCGIVQPLHFINQRISWCTTAHQRETFYKRIGHFGIDEVRTPLQAADLLILFEFRQRASTKPIYVEQQNLFPI